LDRERLAQRAVSLLPPARARLVISQRPGSRVVGGVRESYMGNARAVYEWCLAQGLDGAWLHASRHIDVAIGPAYNFRTVRGALAAARASVSMGGSNNGAPWPLISDRTWVVQGWHGTPLKRIGRAFAKHPHERDLRILERPDFFVSPGAEYTRRFMECYDVGPERFWETGNPRNDVLVLSSKADRDERVEQLLRLPGMPTFSRVVLYAPTWREWLAEPTFLDVPDRDLAALDAYLQSVDAVLVLRAHHREARLAMALTSQFTKILVSDALDLPWDVNDWLIASDVLVTDYSSIFFDYLVMDRPVIHLAPDIDEYSKHRGFMVDPYDDFAGPVVATQRDLTQAIGTAISDPADHADRRADLNRIHNPHEDGLSASRVGTRIVELSGRRRPTRRPAPA
jgi:CDP-glycerol glycerophosphotransferase